MSFKSIIPLVTLVSLFFSACGDTQITDLNSTDISQVTANSTSIKSDETFVKSDSNETTLSEENATTIVEEFTINGRAIDGYLQVALVCIDANLDESCLDENFTTRTDEYGFYTLALNENILEKIQKEKLPVLVYGGVDSDSNKRYRGKLKAVVDTNLSTINITPITSVVYAAYNSGLSLKDAKEQTATTLGLTELALHSDFIEEQSSDALAVALSLQKSLEVLSKTDSEIALGYTQLGATMKDLASEENATIHINSLVDFIATLDSSSSALEAIELVTDISQQFSASDVNQSNALNIFNENLAAIKDIAENNNSALKDSLMTLVRSVVANDINSSLKSTYINKLLLSSLDIKDVDSLINQLDSSLIDLSSSATVTEIVSTINEKNPGFIRATLSSVTDLVIKSGLDLSTDFLSGAFTQLLSSESNVSTIFSTKALLNLAVNSSGDIFKNLILNSTTLSKFIADEPNMLIKTTLQLSGLNVSESTIDTLASINLNIATDSNRSTSLMNYALNLIKPKSSDDNSTVDTNSTSITKFTDVIFNFVLDSIDGSSHLQKIALKEAIKLVASKRFGVALTSEDVDVFLQLYSDKNINITNLASYYDLLKKFTSKDETVEQSNIKEMK